MRKWFYESNTEKLNEDFNKFDKSFKNKLQSVSENIMVAYQNANKHLDEIKEVIYTDLSCPFFSSFVHSLAHTMPGRFDKFGDILHTINMRVPYPTTKQLDKIPENITDCFTIIFETLDYIKETLNAFIDATDKECHGMAVSAENLLNDIESEYPMLYRLEKKWEQSQDLVEFDKYVMQYVEHKSDLLESKKIRRSNMSNLVEDMRIDNKSMDHYSIEQVFEPLKKFDIDLKNAGEPDSYILTFDAMHLLAKKQDDHIIVYEPDYGYEQALIKTTYGALYYCLKEYNSVSFSRSSYRVDETKREITADSKLYGIKMSEYIERDDPFGYACKAKYGRLK